MLTTLLGGRAFAERFGAEPAQVLALHGWGRSSADWRGTLEGLDALALDLPGFGATPAPEAGWTTSDYAGMVREVLSSLDRPVLMGHSFGGRIAVQAGAAYPELVRGIVLTGVPLLRSPVEVGKPALRYRMARFLHRHGALGDRRMEAYRQRYGSADYRNAHGVMREVLVKAVNEDYEMQLGALRKQGMAVEMVWGEHDTAAPVAVAERARALLGDDANLTVVDGSGHLLDPPLAAALRAAIGRLG